MVDVGGRVQTRQRDDDAGKRSWLATIGRRHVQLAAGRVPVHGEVVFAWVPHPDAQAIRGIAVADNRLDHPPLDLTRDADSMRVVLTLVPLADWLARLH